MLQILGRSDILLILEVIKKIIGIIPLLLGIFIGIYSMLWGVVVTGVISFFLNSYFTGKKLNYSSWMQLKDISGSFAISVIISIIIYYLKYLPLSYWIILPLQLTLGAILLILICEKLKMNEYMEIKAMIKSIMKRI